MVDGSQKFSNDVCANLGCVMNGNETVRKSVEMMVFGEYPMTEGEKSHFSGFLSFHGKKYISTHDSLRPQRKLDMKSIPNFCISHTTPL